MILEAPVGPAMLAARWRNCKVGLVAPGAITLALVPLCVGNRTESPCGREIGGYNPLLLLSVKVMNTLTSYVLPSLQESQLPAGVRQLPSSRPRL